MAITSRRSKRCRVRALKGGDKAMDEDGKGSVEQGEEGKIGGKVPDTKQVGSSNPRTRSEGNSVESAHR